MRSSATASESGLKSAARGAVTNSRSCVAPCGTIDPSAGPARALPGPLCHLLLARPKVGQSGGWNNGGGENGCVEIGGESVGDNGCGEFGGEFSGENNSGCAHVRGELMTAVWTTVIHRLGPGLGAGLFSNARTTLASDEQLAACLEQISLLCSMTRAAMSPSRVAMAVGNRPYWLWLPGKWGKYKTHYLT